MTIFAVIRQPGDNQVRLEPAVKGLFPNHYDVGNGVWLISAGPTAKDVSDRLQVTDGTNGSAIVVEVGSYFGRANPAIWTWLKSNWGANTVG